MWEQRNSENARNGRDFEQELLECLKLRGFYATKLTSTNGTAFDIIAAKNGKVLGIEAKRIIHPAFPLSNLTVNEREGMARFVRRGNPALIVFRWDGTFYAKDFTKIDWGKRSIKMTDCELLETYLRSYDV